jgi:uncharacterized protein YjbI with pentapeptide repeats
MNNRLTNCDFSNANLSSANLSEADLTSSDLNGANLNGANLNGTILESVNLESASIINANLTRVNLSDANCVFCIFVQTNLSNRAPNAIESGAKRGLRHHAIAVRLQIEQKLVRKDIFRHKCQLWTLLFHI